jgi:hypothetical protein
MKTYFLKYHSKRAIIAAAKSLKNNDIRQCTTIIYPKKRTQGMVNISRTQINKTALRTASQAREL